MKNEFDLDRLMRSKERPGTDLGELLMRNHRKIEELARQGDRLEKMDMLKVAYMAGRLDGAADAMLLGGKTA